MFCMISYVTLHANNLVMYFNVHQLMVAYMSESADNYRNSGLEILVLE